MNKKLLAGMAAAGLLAGGGGAAALATAGVPSAAASTVAVASSTSRMPSHGPLGSLVAKGTITQSQATAIQNALISYMHSHRQNMPGPRDGDMSAMLGRGGALDTVLGQLVDKGTITKTQASAVTSAFTQWMRAHCCHGTGHHCHGWGIMGGSGNGMMQYGC
jgi:polyhydroxyalkanoate synthesis regulator phasin